MRYLHVQQLQSDGELKIHKVSTENADLMMKYLETAKIKKQSKTIGLHPFIGNKTINMISNRPLRPRGSYTSRPRGTTPQPRQRLPAYIEVNEDHIVKVEERDEVLRTIPETTTREDFVTTGEEDQYKELYISFNDTNKI
eukprot:383463-Amphidinium_carterae.3